MSSYGGDFRKWNEQVCRHMWDGIEILNISVNKAKLAKADPEVVFSFMSGHKNQLPIREDKRSHRLSTKPSFQLFLESSSSHGDALFLSQHDFLIDQPGAPADEFSPTIKSSSLRRRFETRSFEMHSGTSCLLLVGPVLVRVCVFSARTRNTNTN